VPVAVQASGEVRFLKDVPDRSQWEIRSLLVRRRDASAYLPDSPTAH
jgi:hypothetical protein